MPLIKFSRFFSTLIALLMLSIGSATLAQSTETSPVPNLINYSGVLTDANNRPLSGVIGVTFLLYKDEQGGAPLWLETQNVTLDKTGHYTVQLGSTSAHGLPSDLFMTGEARWLAVQVAGQPEQPRVLLVAVPYALKASDAQTIGGLPPSAFVLAAPVNSSTTQNAPGSSASAASASAPPPASSSSVTTTGGTANTLSLFTTATNIQNSAITQTGSGATAKIGINTTAPGVTLDVNGTEFVRGMLGLPAIGTATSAAGKNSQPQDFVASAFDSSTSKAVPQKFQWQAEPAGNNTTAPSGTLNLLYASGATAPAETGLKISNNGIFTFASGQTFPGTGTITGVTASMGLMGGGTSGSVTVGLASNACNAGNALTGLPFTCSPFATLGSNTFTGNQTVSGNLSSTGVVTGSSFQIGTNLFGFGSYAKSNAFLGFAGNTTTTGATNTAEGYQSLFHNTVGCCNVANGTQALFSNTTGCCNAANGQSALISNNTGSNNTADGYQALYSNTTGGYNTAIGIDALSANNTGSNNTSLGRAAGGTPGATANTTGSSNTFLGAVAVPGSGNLTNATAIGANAEVTSNNALVLGSIAGVNGAASSVNVGIGTTAPAATLDVHGTGNFTGLVTFAPGQTFNTTTGTVSGEVVNSTSGFDIGGTLFAFGSATNTFLGFTGNSTNTGGANTAIGSRALKANTSGNLNTAVGSDSLQNNTTGLQNTAVGVNTLAGNTTGSDNTATGEGALSGNTTGSTNVGQGFEALAANSSGNNNTGLGSFALELSAGSNNTGVGFTSGYTPDLQHTTGSNNTFLGSSTVVGGPNETTVSNATAIGANAEVDQSNAMVLGSINGVNNATADTAVGIGTTTPFNTPLAGNPATKLNIVGNNTYVPLVVQSPSTFGTWMVLNNTSTGGKPWAILSAASGNGEGAGNLGITDFGQGGTIILEGNVSVSGTLSKASGSFKIDHPLDPANKFLYHSFVESPDMMNVYNGNITTNKSGLATVVLPDYFEALNRDFRYQLTVIGQFAQAIIAKEISHGRFTIKTSKPGVKVSWQVTGIRQDAYANAHRIPVEEEKSLQEQGHYLHPELFGASSELAIGSLPSGIAIGEQRAVASSPQQAKH